jgi:HEAT repeat protein
MKPKSEYFYIAIFFLLIGCTSDLNPKNGKISEQNLQQLIRQLEYGELRWDSGGKDQGPFYIDMLGSTHYKKDAASLLGKLAQNKVNVDAAVPALVKSLTDHGSEYVSEDGIVPLRKTAAHTLGIIRNPDAIDGLIDLYKESKQCLNALYAEPTKAHCDYSGYPANSNLDKIKEDQINAIVGRQNASAIALGEIGVKRPDVINLLLQGIQDKSPETLASCATALAKLNVNQAIDILINRIQNDPDKTIQSAAVKSLGAFGEKAEKSIPIIISRIQLSVEPSIEEIETLGKIGTPNAINTLNEFIRSNNPKLRDAAKRAQANLEREQNRKELEEAGQI